MSNLEPRLHAIPISPDSFHFVFLCQMTSIWFILLHLHLHILKGNIGFAIMVWHMFCCGIGLAREILLQYLLASKVLRVLCLGWFNNKYYYAESRKIGFY